MKHIAFLKKCQNHWTLLCLWWTLCCRWQEPGNNKEMSLSLLTNSNTGNPFPRGSKRGTSMAAGAAAAPAAAEPAPATAGTERVSASVHISSIFRFLFCLQFSFLLSPIHKISNPVSTLIYRVFGYL